MIIACNNIDTHGIILSSPPQLFNNLDVLYVEADDRLSSVEGMLGPNDDTVSGT